MEVEEEEEEEVEEEVEEEEEEPPLQLPIVMKCHLFQFSRHQQYEDGVCVCVSISTVTVIVNFRILLHDHLPHVLLYPSHLELSTLTED